MYLCHVDTHCTHLPQVLLAELSSLGGMCVGLFGHTLVCADRWFGSLDVALQLNRRRRAFIVACQRNRPAHLWNRLEPGLAEGTTAALQHRPSGVTAWAFRDSSATLKLMTNGVAGWGSLPGRPRQREDQVQRPRVRDAYQDSMGQADKFAQMITNFRYGRRLRKWTDAVRHYTLDMAATNAFIVHNLNRRRRGEAPVTHVDFLAELVSGLCERHGAGCP